MKYIIVDLEATCSEDRSVDNEIIEIGAVAIDSSSFSRLGEFDAFVRPTENPVLTDYCRELTSITQKDVDCADLFPDVLKEFLNWIGRDYHLFSWGDYDRKQFVKDCHRHGLDTSWIEGHHTNLKKAACRTMMIKPRGMVRMLRHLQIPLKGTHHRGIDDARNIAEIFMKTKDALQLPAAGNCRERAGR